MCSSPRGKALVINNQQFCDPELYPFRLGADVDSESLDQLFTQLGFEVIRYENLRRSETMKILIDFADTVGNKENPCDMLIGETRTIIPFGVLNYLKAPVLLQSVSSATARLRARLSPPTALTST